MYVHSVTDLFSQPTFEFVQPSRRRRTHFQRTQTPPTARARTVRYTFGLLRLTIYEHRHPSTHPSTEPLPLDLKSRPWKNPKQGFRCFTGLQS